MIKHWWLTKGSDDWKLILHVFFILSAYSLCYILCRKYAAHPNSAERVVVKKRLRIPELAKVHFCGVHLDGLKCINTVRLRGLVLQAKEMLCSLGQFALYPFFSSNVTQKIGFQNPQMIATISDFSKLERCFFATAEIPVFERAAGSPLVNFSSAAWLIYCSDGLTADLTPALFIAPCCQGIQHLFVGLQ